MAYQGNEQDIPLVEYGLVGTKNLANIPQGSMVLLTNISMDQGPLTRAYGSAKYNATPLSGTPKIQAVLDWWPTSAQQRVVVYGSDGKVMRDDAGAGTFTTTMKTALTTTGLPMWCEGGAETLARNRKAFLTTGKDVVQVIDGDAAVTRDIGASKPADWATTNQPRCLVIHHGRLWGALGHRLYCSTTGDHEDFQGLGSATIVVYPGEALLIQGMASYKESLFCWKYPRGLYILNDQSLNVLNWTQFKLTDAIGLAGPNALAHVDGDVVFLSELGHLHLLSMVRAGDVSASDLTMANELQDWTNTNLDVSVTALEQARGIYYPFRKEAVFAVRGKGATVNNLKLIVDLNTSRPRIRVEDKDTCESLALWRDANGIQRLVAGDNAGTLWKLDQATKDKAGVSYQSTFQTGPTTLGVETRQKNLQAIEAIMQPLGNYDLFLDMILDGRYSQTVTISTLGGGAAIGSFVIGTDVLAGDGLRNYRRRIRGTCRRMSTVGRMSGVGPDFSLSRLIVSSKPGGMKT